MIRLVTLASENPSEWFEDSNDVQRVRRDIALVFDKLVCAIDTASGKINYADLKGVSEDSKVVIQSFLQSLPRATRASENLDLLLIGDGRSDSIAIADLPNHDSLIDVFNLIGKEVTSRTGETSKSFFDRTIGPMLTFAKGVEVLDPYFGTAILRNNFFFLNELIAHPALKVKVLTTAKDDTQKGISLALAVSKIGDRFTRWADLNFLKDGYYSLKIVRHHRYIHDRQMRIIFDYGSVTVKWSNSVDKFGTKIIDGTLSVSSSSNEAFQNGKAIWKTFGGRPTEFLR